MKHERRRSLSLVRRCAARRLRMEQLEARLLLSVGADGEGLRATYYPDSQMLKILGTDQPDAAAVWTAAEGTVSVESPLGVPIQIRDPQGNPTEPTVDEVDSLLVNLYGGDDWLAVGYHSARNELAPGMGVEPSPFVVANIAVDLGEGGDTLLWNTVAASPNWQINAGSGNDDVTAKMGVEPSPFSPPPAKVVINLGGGDDTILTDLADATFGPDGQGSIEVVVSGGDGSDVLTVLTPSPENMDFLPRGAPVSVRFDSGPGDADAVEVVTTDGDEKVTVFGSIEDDVPGGRQFLVDVMGRGTETLAAAMVILTTTRVAVDTGGGDDVVKVRAFEDDFQVESFFDISYDINLGEGDNLLTLDAKGNDVAVKVQAGGGADKAIVRVKPVPASPAGMSPGKLTAEIDLGGGDDVVKVRTLEDDFQVDSFFDISFDINLGEGNNLLALDGKGNDVAVKVQAGGGADRAIVRMKPVPASPAGMSPSKLTAEIDLGGGDDVVKVRTLEDDFQVDSFFDISFDINLGEGNNLLALDGKGNDIAVKVQAGGGADKAIVRMKPVPASPAGMSPSKLTAEIDLGGGDDVVKVRTLEDDFQVDSFFDISFDINLGEGNNLLALDGKGDDVAVEVQGGRNVDLISMEVIASNSINCTIATGGGSDVINGSYSVAASRVDVLPFADIAEEKAPSSIQVVAGSGDDHVALQLAGLLDRAMHVGVLGQRGHDQLHVEATQLDINNNGALSVGINGGQGDDRIGFFNRAADPPCIEGRLRLSLAGGRGNDTIVAFLASDDSGTGDISAKVMGGAGNDLLTLLAEGVAGRFLIDGGRGRDQYLASDNVRVRNCEGLIENPETIGDYWDRFY